MKQQIYRIQSNERIAEQTYEMVLAGDTAGVSAPGQFINIRLAGFFLRRPISICDWEDGRLTIVYKVVGQGTRAMAQLAAGAELDILCPLGNGYDLNRISGRQPVIVGGGAGVPPMYGLTKALLAQGREPRVILGFGSEKEVFYEEKFRRLGVEPVITTVDGSYGTRGLVTDVLADKAGYICACGPEPMLRAVYERASHGQFSFEARMGCGFGGCMGCTCETLAGPKRICTDGPVLKREEIKWQK